MDEALAATQLDRRRDGGERLRQRHRQCRGIPVDPHPNSEQVGARSNHVHAARWRQVRLQGLRNLGGLHGVGVSSPMRCPSAWRSRSRASNSFTRWLSCAANLRASWRKPAAWLPARHQDQVPARSADFGPKAAFQAERVFKMARSKAYLYGGVEIRWHCAKNCCAASTTCRKRPPSISPTG